MNKCPICGSHNIHITIVTTVGYIDCDDCKNRQYFMLGSDKDDTTKWIKTNSN